LGGARLQEPLVLGAVEEVQRIESYRRDPDARPHDAPLFGSRGLFRPVV
jgi:fructose-1,6-bisphosphatase I/sedoheptulose-1,7-bisphosphatase